MIFGKIPRFILTTIVFVEGVFSASLPVTEEDINNNIIIYGDDSVEGLTPPMLEAKNYFNAGKSVGAAKHPYVVEIHRGFIKIKTTGFTDQGIRLNKTETEGIQKLSLSFVELLNSSKLAVENSKNETEAPDWRDLNPVIILSNSGISLQFFNVSQQEENLTEMTTGNKRILWDFLTKYARNIFEEKLKMSEKFAEFFDTPSNDKNSFDFQNFLDFLWSMMKLSVDYAETAFEGWTTSRPETTEAPEVEKKARSSTATLFAYEEPSPFHEFPSQEFQYRRKDIDSIFYGRGVI